mmetsp:Transcript_52530/g.79720  ORF Transcript_52530/g.79720 Transcript_52530/m.79720 type:complete len:198 (+) Transcript_52530:210-803(+)
MSSWERSRSIPWSKIPEDATDLSHQREKIFRQLQREADRQEKALHSKAMESSGQQQENDTKKLSAYTFRWTDLFKSAAFGGCIGSITGTVFGFMDGMRTAQQSDVLMKASNVAKGKYLLEGTTRSATVFGVFFGGYHVVKYGLRVTVDPGEFSEIAMSSVVSLGALMSRPSFRPSMPYASMLIFMDGVNIVMREFND